MDDLLIKYMLDETTPQERAQVQQWLAADAGNQVQFEKLQRVWQVAAQPNSQLNTNTPQALQRLKQTLQTKQPVPVKRIWARIGTAAAVVVGLAGVVLGAYVVMKPKVPAKKTTPVVKPDTVRQMRLPVDTLPVDTIPAVKPHKKKLTVPAAPAQPVRPQKKAIQPVHPVDTLPVKKKQAMPVQPSLPAIKHKAAPLKEPAPILIRINKISNM